MSDFVTLHPQVLLFPASASTVGSWYPVDYKYGGIQQRSVSGTKNTDDTVLLEVMTSVESVQVIATATAWVSGITSFSAILQGPFMAVRARKTGANGGASVVGVL